VVEPANCAGVIPCFNEGASITALVVAVRQHLPAVMVVDDGSTDDTSALARAAGAVVVSHARNPGRGAAFSSGLSQALEQGFEWAFTLDGDGQHTAEELKQFLLRKLPSWQVPREWWFAKSLDANARGNVSRAQWRGKFLEMRAQAAAEDKGLSLGHA